ncbi:MAG: PilZ domain-containing protein [Deltaproteobacteria bacterium]|nr:PilZ domain-containing protein [Deltaproteobacteria bacterium]
MSEKKASWDDIPSLEDLEVDWKFEPENPLGKRAHVRMTREELYSVLEVKSIPVKVVAKDFEEKGYLVDITPGGIAVTLDSRLEQGKPLMAGFFLGQQKIVSKVKVKNVLEVGGKYKTGMVFENLDEEYADFITGISAAKSSYL